MWSHPCLDCCCKTFCAQVQSACHWPETARGLPEGRCVALMVFGYSGLEGLVISATFEVILGKPGTGLSRALQMFGSLCIRIWCSCLCQIPHCHEVFASCDVFEVHINGTLTHVFEWTARDPWHLESIESFEHNSAINTVTKKYLRDATCYFMSCVVSLFIVFLSTLLEPS